MELENYSWSDMKRKLVDFVSKAYEVNPDVDDLGDYLPFMALENWLSVAIRYLGSNPICWSRLTLYAELILF